MIMIISKLSFSFNMLTFNLHSMFKQVILFFLFKEGSFHWKWRSQLLMKLILKQIIHCLIRLFS